MSKSLAQWVAARLDENDGSRTTTVYDEMLISLERPNLGSTKIACVRVDVLDECVVRSAIAKYPNVKFIVNVKQGARVAGDAYKLAEGRGISFGGIGDLMRALHEPDMADYIPPETRYRERIFEQHHKIMNFERLDDSRYRIFRYDFPPIVVYISLDYEVTADQIRTAIDKYGDFDAFVTSNPNATSISPEAVTAAMQSGRKVFLWPQFMGAINRSWN
jgi:hypothetical protein